MLISQRFRVSKGNDYDGKLGFKPKCMLVSLCERVHIFIFSILDVFMKILALLMSTLFSMNVMALEGVLERNFVFAETPRQLQFSGTLNSSEFLDLSSYDEQVLLINFRFVMPKLDSWRAFDYPEPLDLDADITVSTVARVPGNDKMSTNLTSIDRGQRVRVYTDFQRGTQFRWDLDVVDRWYPYYRLICENGEQWQYDVAIEITDELGTQLANFDATTQMNWFFRKREIAYGCDWDAKKGTGNNAYFLFEQAT